MALTIAAHAGAQEIEIRISVKYIYFGDTRPSGQYSDAAAVQDIIDQVNERTLNRWNRGYRYVITEFRDVIGASAFSDISSDAEFKSLENAAEADPGRFFWRTDAVNLYIVSSFFAGGAAAIPSNAPSDTDYELVVFAANAGSNKANPPDVLWPHELGHHFDLYHTFGNDLVSDTRLDPNPTQCMPNPMGLPCTTTTTGPMVECCCATKLSLVNTAAANQGWSAQERTDILFNNMSYHCNLTLDNIRMTPGQLDRWTDATRLFHWGEVSGFTYFVQRSMPVTRPYSGLSTDPYPNLAGGIAAANPNGGDIVLLRAGNYDEPMTITKPLTLRASRGNVNIGLAD